jgi:hypothetical protein
MYEPYGCSVATARSLGPASPDPYPGRLNQRRTRVTTRRVVRSLGRVQFASSDRDRKSLT